MHGLTVHAVKVPIRPDEVSPIIWHALANGSYEAKEARAVTRAVRSGDRVLELGSGIGIITSIMATISEVKIWAFEANPSTVSLARRVIAANDLDNVTLSQGILTADGPRHFDFYVRKDLWMSSMVKSQGPYEEVISIQSSNIDFVIADHDINVLVMDIEGAERELLQLAALPGIERIFVELHDHLYGLEGIREITGALADKGFAYDPRGSSGPCVLFSQNDGPREYEPEQTDEI